MVQVIIDVETPTLGGNLLIHSSHFINIATRITLGEWFNGKVWQHLLSLSLMMQIWHSISGTCSIVEVLLISTFIFVSSTFMGLNYLSIRSFLILNPFLLYMDLTVPIELVIWFIVPLLMHFIVMNFRLRLMVAKNIILLKNRIYPPMVIFLLALKIICRLLYSQLPIDPTCYKCSWPSMKRCYVCMFSRILWFLLE